MQTAKVDSAELFNCLLPMLSLPPYKGKSLFRGNTRETNAPALGWKCHIHWRIFFWKRFNCSTSTDGESYKSPRRWRFRRISAGKATASLNLLLLFIQWYVDNFDAIRNMIDKKLTTFRKNNAKSVVHGRLLDTQFYLQVSYLIFLEFCVDSGFCSEQDAPEELSSFSEQLAELIRLHQARFNLSADFPEEVDYLKLIRKLYKNEKFNLAVDAKQFNSGDYDGLVYYDCLCLRGKRIDNAISKIVPGTKREDWVAFMVKNKVLKTVGNKLSVQISGCSGLRFYAIRLEKLK